MTERQTSRSRRSCCGYILGIFLVLMLGLGASFAWFYRHPISNDKLHERVVRRLERISGLNVDYDLATLTLSTGRYHIKNLRFSSPSVPETTVLQVGDVYATIRPWDILSKDEAVLNHVVLKNPSQLDLIYSEDSVKLGKRSEFLVNSVQQAQPPGSSVEGRLPFEDLIIENVDLALQEEDGILPQLTTSPPAMVMKGDLKVSNGRTDGLTLQFTGDVHRPLEDNVTTVANGVDATVVMNRTEIKTLKVQAKQVALSDVFRAWPQTTLQGDNLALELGLDIQDDQRDVKGWFTAGALNFDSPEQSLKLHDEAVRIDGNLAMGASSGEVLLRSLVLNSDSANATVEGNIAYKANPFYKLGIRVTALSKDYRVILERMLPQGWDVQAKRDSFDVNMVVSGTDKGVSEVTGKAAVRGIDLVSPELPVPLRNVQGDLEFTTDVIRLTDFTGDYAGTRVALDGSFAGDLWQKRMGNLDLAWSSMIPLDQVLKLHGGGLSGSGVIRGHGTWRQSIGLDDEQNVVPKVEGEINFQDVAFKHSSLPAPIAGLNGKTRILGNRLVVEQLSGLMQGNELVVAGEVVGSTFFWKDAQVSASLQSRLDLAALGPYLTATQQQTLSNYEVSGKAETAVILNGPLMDLASSFTGEVTVSDLSFTPRLDFLNGKFTGVKGALSWDGRSLRLSRLDGLFNGEELTLKGDISSRHMDLSVQTNADLAAVSAMFPKLDQFFDMSGGLDTDVKFILGEPSEDEVPASLAAMLESARILVDEGVKNKKYSLNGSLVFSDASLRHISMPVARKERGRNIPAGRITGLTGRVEIKNDTLIASDKDTLSCAFSDTENCRLSGTMKIRANDFPEIKARISTQSTLKLDTWILGWGKEIPHPDNPPVTNKKFDLDLDISAPKVLFRGQEAGAGMAKVNFKFVQDKTPRITTFRDVVVQGGRAGAGRVIGNGTIESYSWNPREYPKWRTSLDVDNMPLENLLAAVFADPANIRGTITGGLNLTGVNDDARSIQGQGSGFMRNLEIGGTEVIRQLGQTTGRNFGGMLFQTARSATFQIGNGALSSRDLALETNGLQLEMRGDYWYSKDNSRGVPVKTIDGTLRLRLFKSVLGNIPIVGQLAELADEVANSLLLAFRVTGTADNPRVTPVALPVFQGAA